MSRELGDGAFVSHASSISERFSGQKTVGVSHSNGQGKASQRRIQETGVRSQKRMKGMMEYPPSPRFGGRGGKMEDWGNKNTEDSRQQTEWTPYTGLWSFDTGSQILDAGQSALQMAPHKELPSRTTYRIESGSPCSRRS